MHSTTATISLLVPCHPHDLVLVLHQHVIARFGIIVALFGGVFVGMVGSAFVNHDELKNFFFEGNGNASSLLGLMHVVVVVVLDNFLMYTG